MASVGHDEVIVRVGGAGNITVKIPLLLHAPSRTRKLACLLIEKNVLKKESGMTFYVPDGGPWVYGSMAMSRLQEINKIRESCAQVLQKEVNKIYALKEMMDLYELSQKEVTT